MMILNYNLDRLMEYLSYPKKVLNDDKISGYSMIIAMPSAKNTKIKKIYNL